MKITTLLEFSAHPKRRASLRLQSQIESNGRTSFCATLHPRNDRFHSLVFSVCEREEIRLHATGCGVWTLWLATCCFDLSAAEGQQALLLFETIGLRINREQAA